MAGDRLRGEETQIRFSKNGAHIESVSAVRSFDITFNLKLLDEGYLGETTQRKDEIFNGISGKCKLHLEKGEIFDLIGSVVDRARRVPGAIVKIAVSTILLFPDGRQKVLFIPDIKFGDIPLNSPDRGSYVEVDLSWEASDFEMSDS